MRWPFRDSNKALRGYHDTVLETVKLSSRAFYPTEEHLAAYDTKMHKLRQGAVLRNPFGLYMLNVSVPDFNRFLYTSKRTEADITVSKYVAESLRDNDFENFPIDPLAGELFIVTDIGNTVRIESERAPSAIDCEKNHRNS